ncbi:MAG: molybdopterin-dependent oxidoreductase, partial [Desulfobacterales bacterium]|nr:molybdopterin-dependent oxidoreductase [Desulfobacterales bacterium]
MCDTRCAIDVHLKDGVIVKIRPFAGHPANKGKICPRANAAIDQFYHPDRVTLPLKRTPDGSFVQISRDQALDEIADKIGRIKKEHGAEAAGVWKGEGVGFFQQEEYARRFTRALGSPNYFSNDSSCYNSRFFGFSLVTGFWNPFPDFSGAGLILLLGTNPPACHPTFMREVAEATRRGTKLVMVDPRRNPIAHHAHIFAEPHPGTDGALGWGLIRYIIETNNYDHELVERYSVGFEKIARYARKFTPERVERESGVYASVVVEIGELMAKHRPGVSIFVGAGLEHHENGVNNIRTFTSLSCLLGALDTGCGLFWPEKMGVRSLTLDDEIPLPGKNPIGADRFPVFHELRSECHTMTAMAYMMGRGAYPLKGMVMTAANPAVTNPNTRVVEKALSNLDLLVVNDFFLTRTARLAHYVLPAASFLERSELHFYTKLQRVNLTRKIMEIPGVKDEYMLWRDLAHRLGFGEKYFPWKNEEEVTRWILEPTGVSLESLKERPEGFVFKPVRHHKHFTRPLPTPSGKIEFASSYLKKFGLPEIPLYTPPLHIGKKDRRYPFVLTTGARKTLLYHSRHQNIPRFRRVHSSAEVEIHPGDAATLGI